MTSTFDPRALDATNVKRRARDELMELAEQWTQSAAQIHRHIHEKRVRFPPGQRLRAEVLNEKAAMLLHLIETIEGDQ